MMKIVPLSMEYTKIDVFLFLVTLSRKVSSGQLYQAPTSLRFKMVYPKRVSSLQANPF